MGPIIYCTLGLLGNGFGWACIHLSGTGHSQCSLYVYVRTRTSYLNAVHLYYTV